MAPNLRLNDRIYDAMEAYDRLKDEGDPVTVDDLDLNIETVEGAMSLHRAAVRIRKAAQAIEAATAVQLADTLGDGGAVRYGNTVYRYAKGWKETVNDVGAFWSMVRMFDGKGDLRIEDLFNPNDVRVTPLPDAIRDTAFTRIRDEEPSLKAVPVDKIPAFLQELEDGDYVLGRRV